MMRRFEKYGEITIKTITFPIRALIGLGKCIHNNMPEKLELPFTIKKKEANDGNASTKANS